MSETAAPTRDWVVGDVQRHWLDATTWVDVGRGWLADPDEVYAGLTADGGPMRWRANEVYRYDHAEPENRLSGWTRPGPGAAHEAVTAVHRALRERYAVPLDGASACWYRDGRDAMGAHRDSDLRHCDDTVIAIVTLGATRPWTLQRVGSRRPDIDLAPGAGDLVVMGGRAQRDWLHGVPPAPGVRGGRVSLQWRWTSGRGRPETGGSSGAPRRYGHGR